MYVMIGVVLLVVALAIVGIYYYRKSIVAALGQESARVSSMEKAQADARAQRVKAFDEKAAAVKSPSDAIELLESVTDHGPHTN